MLLLEPRRQGVGKHSLGGVADKQTGLEVKGQTDRKTGLVKEQTDRQRGD